jgi:peroxiredoxin family protein
MNLIVRRLYSRGQSSTLRETSREEIHLLFWGLKTLQFNTLGFSSYSDCNVQETLKETSSVLLPVKLASIEVLKEQHKECLHVSAGFRR